MGANAAQSSKHVPSGIAGGLDPVERMLHATEVRLGGEGEQVVAAGHRFAEFGLDHRAVEPQLLGAHGQIGDRRAVRACELADAVDRVVVVVGQKVVVAALERI